MKNVLILGATSGIAKATAYYMATQGIQLILAGRNLTELEQIAKDIQIRHQVHASCVHFDALDYESHQGFFDNCLQLQGQLDGIILAYGHMEDQYEAQLDFTKARRTIDTNYVSAVSILNIASNYYEQEKRGFLCVITSVAGDRGRQSNYIYGSSKGALAIYLQGARNRLFKSNVSVITIKPGFVHTRMTFGKLKDSPLVAKPEQIAKLIYKAIRKRKHVAYTPFFWFYIMQIIKMMPEFVFKRLKL